ncbi:MAG TPA: DUF2062 domain-containing protein [Steroidobacteraceae bacterium]|nr:DUF2062 domain-containing protein [Steroidobacteraceae bacterium]
MPRRLLKKITPHPEKLRKRWFLKLFGSRVADPRLWSLQRRSVTAAFATGLAICFVPLPIHLLLAALLAIVARLNVPTIIATVCLVNPLTVVPVFYTAYRVGCAVLGVEPQRFTFKFSFDWLQNGLGPMWEPFLLGCLICAGLAALTGWVGLELLWRWQVRSKYRARRLSSIG